MNTSGLPHNDDTFLTFDRVMNIISNVVLAVGNGLLVAGGISLILAGACLFGYFTNV